MEAHLLRRAWQVLVKVNGHGLLCRGDDLPAWVEKEMSSTINHKERRNVFLDQNIPINKGPTNKNFLKLHLLAKIKP